MGDSVQTFAAEQRPYWHVALSCPKCGASGMIPWDRLDRVLGCQRCSSWFRVERGALVEIASPEASMQVSVRGSFGEWQTHRLRPRDWTNSWLRRGGSLLTCLHHWLVGLNWPRRIALGSGFLAALVAAVFALSDSAAAPLPPPKPLPTELAARASLFTEAWLDRDMPTMLKLTDKSFDRQLRQWSSKAPPPSAADRSQRKVEAMVSHREAHRATVTVRISPAGQVSSNRITQQQQWTDKNGIWYFVPSFAPKPSVPGGAVPRRIR